VEVHDGLGGALWGEMVQRAGNGRDGRIKGSTGRSVRGW
jgi:hypothetical protein